MVRITNAMIAHMPPEVLAHVAEVQRKENEQQELLALYEAHKAHELKV